MSESDKESTGISENSSKELLDKFKEQTSRTPSPELSVKSNLSISGSSCENRPCPKDSGSFIPMQITCSLNTDTKSQNKLTNESSSSNSWTKSPSSPGSSNQDKYFPICGHNEDILPGSNRSQQGISSDLKPGGGNEKQAEFTDTSRDTIKGKGKYSNHLLPTKNRNSPKTVSGTLQKQDCATFESCMKFAEILYKCTLCTTLPSILTSKQSFLEHVKQQHLNAETSRFSCSQCVLNFCMEEDLNFHVKANHPQIGKGPLSLSDLSDDSDSNDNNVIQVQSQTSKAMWAGDKEQKTNACKVGGYKKLFKPFRDSHDSVSVRGIQDMASLSPKGQRPLELQRGIMHSGFHNKSKQNKLFPCNIFQNLDQNTSEINSYTSSGMVEIEKLTNHMFRPQNQNIGTMSMKGSNLNSFTPEFGRYTKLVREGGNIVYFCQVCNWKCPVKTIFQTHCRGIQHQSKVQSADDSSGNSSNSPGPCDNRNDSEMPRRENKPVNLCINNDSKKRDADRELTDTSEAEKISSPLGNKSPLRSLLSSSHGASRCTSSMFLQRNSLSEKQIINENISNEYGTRKNFRTDINGLTGKDIGFLKRNYEYSHPFGTVPNTLYTSRFMTALQHSENDGHRLSTSRNRRKRPAPVALRNQFSESDTDSDSECRKKNKADNTEITRKNSTKKELSSFYSSARCDAYNPSDTSKFTINNIIGENSEIQSNNESAKHQKMYMGERKWLSPKPSVTCNGQPHMTDDHTASVKSFSQSAVFHVKQEPAEEKIQNFSYSEQKSENFSYSEEKSQNFAYACSRCSFSTDFLDSYRYHVSKEHGADSQDTTDIWRCGGSLTSDKPDCFTGEHDDSNTERTNMNSEGWKIVKIKGALPDLVQACPRGNVSRDLLLQKLSIILNLPDVVQWGPACNKAVRELFPASLAQRKGKYKKYFFGLEYLEQPTQTQDDSSDTETVNYQPLRDMSRDLDLIIRFLPETVYWTGDMESGVSRDQVLEVLGTKIREPDILHWGVQCNRAARILFPDIQMKRKGKYKSVFYGVEFMNSLHKNLTSVLKPRQIRGNSESSDDVTMNETEQNVSSCKADPCVDKQCPRFQHHWHSSENQQESSTQPVNSETRSVSPGSKKEQSQTDSIAGQCESNVNETNTEHFPLNTPDPDTSMALKPCSPKNQASSNLTSGDDTLRQI